MTFYVYMLKSMGRKSVTYVGYTNNLNKRVALHNRSKGAKFTRGRKWKLIYKEKYKISDNLIMMLMYILIAFGITVLFYHGNKLRKNL